MGILANYRDSVTLVNRTDRVLNVRYDGEDMKLKPGENPNFPVVAVPYAKAQNPLMGSRHPNSPGKFISLIGVKGTKDDCTPIPKEVLDAADEELEVVDRKGKFWNRPMRQNVRVLNHGYDPEEAGVGGSFQDSNSALDAKLG
jgi:hypothetical protein